MEYVSPEQLAGFSKYKVAALTGAGLGAWRREGGAEGRPGLGGAAGGGWGAWRRGGCSGAWAPGWDLRRGQRESQSVEGVPGIGAEGGAAGNPEISRQRGGTGGRSEFWEDLQ